jgi:hypothetical protein
MSVAIEEARLPLDAGWMTNWGSIADVQNLLLLIEVISTNSDHES